MIREPVGRRWPNKRSSETLAVVPSFQRIFHTREVKELLSQNQLVLLFNFPRLTTSTAISLN